MGITSLLFLLFFAVSVTLYYSIPKRWAEAYDVRRLEFIAKISAYELARSVEYKEHCQRKSGKGFFNYVLRYHSFHHRRKILAREIAYEVNHRAKSDYTAL